MANVRVLQKSLFLKWISLSPVSKRTILSSRNHHILSSHQHDADFKNYTSSLNRSLLALNRCYCDGYFRKMLHLGLPVALNSVTRGVHTQKKPLSANITVNTALNNLELMVKDSQLSIPLIWLRDHCRCSCCYNSDTSQKNPDSNLLLFNLIPAAVELDKSEQGVIISWKDGHKSEFNFDWLSENFYPGKLNRRTEQVLWDKARLELETLPVVACADHMNTEAGLKQTLENMVKYGFSIVDGVNASIESTQEVVEHITFVQETLFGKMWMFTSDGARDDTAYSSTYLGPHTDTTYFMIPCGIQVLHCLEHTGSGGKTLLVDGFYAVEKLRKTKPEEFDILKRTIVPHEYVEKSSEISPGHHAYSLGTVITVHPASGEVLNLRYNPYDRAPLNTVPQADIVAFYRAYDCLRKIIEDESGHFWMKLKPGQVLILDNWRVMHGRSAFDGRRTMCGNYMTRDDWVSRARFMGLL